MAILACVADGNFTSSSTWAVVDSTSYLASEAGNENTTTAYTGIRSSAFTPGAIEIDGIGVRLGTRIGTTGTFTVCLELDSGDTLVSGTEVTINCSDLPASTFAAADGGWIFLKFGSPVTLAGATAYQVAAKSSTSAQVNLFRDGTTDNICRYLRTTTTQAPAAGDDLIIAGEWTAAATVTTRTVTMNETATTDYGSAPTAANSLLTPALAVCNNGTLTWGTTAATNYYLKQSGSVIVYRVGTVNMGTTGTPMPRDSTAIWELDPAADGDYGWLVRGGTWNGQGLSRTSGKNIVSCKLNTDEAANSTSLGVDTDTGWLDNDQIAVASTTRTASDCEAGTLNGNAGASSLTVDGFAGTGGGLLVAHSGTSPTQAEVILLTRNVRMRSATSTLMAYFYANADATVDLDWVEFYYMGEAATSKRGVNVATVGGSFNMQFCSIHDCEDNGLYLEGSTLNNVTFSSNTLWNTATVAGPGAQIAAATSGSTITIDSNILIRTGSGNGWTLADVGGTFTNNTVAGAANTGILLSESDGTLGTFSGNTCHACAGGGASIGAARLGGTFGSYTGWRNSQFGVSFSTNGIISFVLDGAVLFGNSTSNINFPSNGVSCEINNSTLNGDTSFSTTYGLDFVIGGIRSILINNGDFSTVSGIKTAHSSDINVSASTNDNRIVLRNTKLGAATEVATQTNLANTGFISAQKLDQTAGNHKTWTRYGTVQTDTTIYNTASPSMRMTPNNASGKLESATQFNGFKKPCDSGGTVSISVYVRKSEAGDGAAYNGNQPRLIQKANPALGQSSDVVIDTVSVAVGSWEQLTGTSSTASGDDGCWEFVVDCDGTAGFVNIDDFA